MKFNWGHGITIVIILFVAGILSMVYITMQQDNSTQLIEENYYDKELVFQQQIDGSHNLNALYPDSLALVDSTNFIYIKLPAQAATVDSGFVEFIRPSDKTKDRRLDLVVNNNGELTLPKSNFINGLYKFRIRWNSNGTTYVKAKDFIIN